MTRKDALATLIRELELDLQGYRDLQALLEEQFQAALGYHTARLSAAIESIMAAVESLQARSDQRDALLKALLGEDASMSGVAARLNESLRTTLQDSWQSLQTQVRECKQLNERNCKLLMSQNDIMQRVLHGEDQIYAPA